MGKYKIDIKLTAQNDLKQLYKSGNNASIIRIEKIFQELENNPTSGTGNPEQLKHQLTGCWSRRINKRDRLIYEIYEPELLVAVLSASGHYN